VDYPEDISVLNAIYNHFDGCDGVPLKNIVKFLDSQSSLCEINGRLHQPFRD